MRDIHISIGLDRGGDSFFVKVVMGFLKQEYPNRLENAPLMAACPEIKDKYTQVAATLACHVAQILRLRYTPVVVGRQRRAVRVFVNRDFPALCWSGYLGPCRTWTTLIPPGRRRTCEKYQMLMGAWDGPRPNLGWLHTCRWSGHRSLLCHFLKLRPYHFVSRLVSPLGSCDSQLKL